MKASQILSSTLCIFAGISLFSKVASHYWIVGDRIEIDFTVIMLSTVFLTLLGMLVGWMWSRLRIEASDAERQTINASVVGFSFLSGICFGGACIPAAALSAIFTAIFLIPISLGIGVTSWFTARTEKNTRK